MEMAISHHLINIQVHGTIKAVHWDLVMAMSAITLTHIGMFKACLSRQCWDTIRTEHNMQMERDEVDVWSITQ